MEQNRIIELTVDFVRETLKGAEGGHDWWHIERVWRLSRKIALAENVHLLTVELAALLHDIADAKFNGGNENEGSVKADNFLKSLNVDADVRTHVVQIVRNVSFKGGNAAQVFHSSELDVVRDADRLDAIGAIGIARTFNYGGFKNRPLYDPEIEPRMGMSPDEYRGHVAPTINHFYEKLLLLADGMKTKTGRQMAAGRHVFMEEFLNRFYAEWEGQQ